MEAVRYATLLTESQRRDFVMKNHGAQLEKSFLSSHIPADIRAQIDPEHVMDGADGKFKEGELAGRIIDFIASHDPSTKKIYTLWMAQRHLKGEMPLEDMPGVERYLAFFDANKLRFTKRDIGQYRTVDELATAVNGFSEKSAPVEKLRDDADMKVIYDSPNLSIVQPKTAAGATELAGDAIWCTAWEAGRNRFYYYDGKGPIYVIIDKKRKVRWQFFMPTNDGYPSAEFMDRANRAIDLKAFLTEYPMVFNVIGEEAFIPYMKKIGLSFFSGAAIRKVDRGELAEMITSVEDLSKFPEDVVNSAEFAQSLITRLTMQYYGPDNDMGKRVRKLVAYYLSKLPDEFFISLFDVRPILFSYMPSRFHTDENKLKVVTNLGHSDILKIIPKPWPVKVEEEFWRKSIIQNDRLTLKEVPEKYLNDEQRVALLLRTPKEITNYSRLNQAMVVRLLALDYKMVVYIPEKFLTGLAADAMMVSTVRASSYDRAAIIQKIGAHFPMSVWPKDAGETLIKSTKAQEASFNDLPKSYRTPELMDAWVKASPTNYIKLPAEFRSVENLAKMLTQYTNHKAIELFTPEICSSHEFALALEKSIDDYYYSADQYKALPKYLKTEEIIRLFMGKGVVPVKEMGRLANTTALAQRIKVHMDEAKDIPASMMNSALAAALVTSNPLVIPFIPEKVRTEDVLYHWLISVKNAAAHYTSTYNSTQKPTIKDDFALFPKSSWSQRTLPLAVELRAIPADLATLPKELVTRELVGAIAGENEDVFSHEDAHIIDEENIVKAIRKNWKVYTKLKPDQIVEATMHAFLAATARDFGYAIKQSKGNWIQESLKQLLNELTPIYEEMPKAKWSARCWQEVVGLVYPLGKVPVRFRTSEKMIVTALTRDASQAKYIDRPGEWLDANAKNLLGGKVDDKTWKEELLKGGLFKTGRNYVDVVDLPHKPLSNGYSYVIVKSGKLNLRIFIFDKKNTVVVRLHTQDHAIKCSSHNEMMAHEKAVREFGLTEKEELRNISPGVLNLVGVQSNTAGDFIPEEKMQRNYDSGVLKWASGSLNGGTLRLAFKGEKVIFKLKETLTGGGWGSQTLRLTEIEPLAKLSMIHPLAKEIAGYLNRVGVSGWRGSSIGVGNGSRNADPWEALTATKIAEVGALAVWRGEGIYNKTISIYHETKGRLASAVIRKAGNFDKIEMRNAAGFENEINALFDSLKGKVPYNAVK